MSSSAPPIIAFELGIGEFKIVTSEAVYQIKVKRDLVDAAKNDDGPRQEENAAQTPAPTQPSSFFQEISEELFEKVGRLARQLSVSVEELPAQLESSDLDQTDQQLESAKGQLEEVVKLTEKASMKIMDSADQIQDDMNQLQKQLDILQSLDFMAAISSAAGPDESDGISGQPKLMIQHTASVDPALPEKLDELKKFVDNLLSAAPEPDEFDDSAEPTDGAAPAEEPAEPEPQAAGPEIKTVTVIRFDVDVVFQTMYELCTNESVKDHIKAMREVKEDNFDLEEIADNLSEMAPTVDEEDGFFNFPIPAVLKTIYSASKTDDFKTILKKMNQTSASIFLDTVLPIEGERVEEQIPVEAAPQPSEETVDEPAEAEPESEPVEADYSGAAAIAAGCTIKDLRTIRNLVSEIERLGAATVASEAPPEDYQRAAIKAQDRDTLIQTASMTRDLIQKTGDHLTHIMETLSFQDLSGQRIMKVVSLIGDIQKQLLSILIAADAKIKVHQETGNDDINSDQVEKKAQAEVDKALEKIGGSGSSLLGPGAEARLDQGAVNDLLAQLGF